MIQAVRQINLGVCRIGQDNKLTIGDVLQFLSASSFFYSISKSETGNLFVF